MTDSDDSKSSKTATAIVELVKAVPVYQDLVQPAAREVGKQLGTAAKAVSIALAPLSVLVWGYEQIRDFVESRVAEKLDGIPADRIRPRARTWLGRLLRPFATQDTRKPYANCTPIYWPPR